MTQVLSNLCLCYVDFNAILFHKYLVKNLSESFLSAVSMRTHVVVS